MPISEPPCFSGITIPVQPSSIISCHTSGLNPVADFNSERTAAISDLLRQNSLALSRIIACSSLSAIERFAVLVMREPSSPLGGRARARRLYLLEFGLFHPR